MNKSPRDAHTSVSSTLLIAHRSASRLIIKDVSGLSSIQQLKLGFG